MKVAELQSTSTGIVIPNPGTTLPVPTQMAVMMAIPDVPRWIVIWTTHPLPSLDSLNIVVTMIGWNSYSNMRVCAYGPMRNTRS